MKNKGNFEYFNIGAENFTTLREDLEALINHAGTASRIIFVPGLLARPALAILDFFNLSPLVDLHYKTIDKDFYFDISKAKKILDWQPKESNKDCLIKAYDWYLKNADMIDKNFGTTHRKAVKKGILSILR